MQLEKFKPSYRGIGKMLKSDDVRRTCTERAERVLEAARSKAPVVTGEYRDGLTLEQVTTDRAVSRVVGTAAHSLAVEANTGNLARALDAAR